ncbi:MAG: alanine racemase [Verrucomicrobia bacterium]|nr:alanine racemase [Verrucomicrobiota bacterium]
MEKLDISTWANCPLVVDQITIDSRRITSKNSLFVALTGSNFDGHAFVRAAFRSGAKACLVRKDYVGSEFGPDKVLIRVDDPLTTLQEMAALYRKMMPAKVIAITGSFGKTMLKDLLYKLLSAQYPTFASPESFNSQIGVALSLLKIKRSHAFAIIEAGISEPGEMDRLTKMIQPDHAILTNCSKALMAEKVKLLESVPKSNWCLAPSYITGLDNVIHWDNHEKRRFEVALHDSSRYVYDLLQIATVAGSLLHIDAQTMEKALQDYVPEPMRIEVFKSQIGTTFINDTYTADPMSCDVALRQMEMLQDSEHVLAGKRIFLFGGLRGERDHIENDMARLAHAIAKHKVNLVILSHPESASHLVSHLTLASPNSEVVVCKDIKTALDAAKRHLSRNDVVLIKGAYKLPMHELIRHVEESPPNNQVIINLAVIEANIAEIRSKLKSDTRIMVMVKALAYGTDDVRIAKFLNSCKIDILGVSYVDEGVQMRQAGIKQSIFVLNAAVCEAAKAVKWDLEVGVSEPMLISSLQQHAEEAKKKIRVHLHVDTGMSRLGCKPEQVLGLAKEIVSSPNLIFEGVFTHFACADDPAQDAFTLHQAKLLQNAIDTLEEAGYSPRWRHACNSSATLRFGFTEFNMVRLGLAAYGLHSSPACRDAHALRPAISLISRIVGINELKKGDTISYGRDYTVTRDHARIAVLPIGYFDGLHRNYSGKGYVAIRGIRAPMVGRICMDYMMVDITDIPEAKIGDQALLFGEDDNGDYIAPEELATLGGSIVHELMTCLGPRIRRFFIYDESLRPR